MCILFHDPPISTNNPFHIFILSIIVQNYTNTNTVISVVTYIFIQVAGFSFSISLILPFFSSKKSAWYPLFINLFVNFSVCTSKSSFLVQVFLIQIICPLFIQGLWVTARSRDIWVAVCFLKISFCFYISRGVFDL